GREGRLARRVHDAVEVPAGERRRGLRDVGRLADQVDLGVVRELAPQRVEAVAVADQIEPDAGVSVVGHRTPAVRIELSVSMRSGLSDALIAGRSSSVQSSFLRT